MKESFKRFGWFALLWVAGVGAVSCIGLVIRAFLKT